MWPDFSSEATQCIQVSSAFCARSGVPMASLACVASDRNRKMNSLICPYDVRASRVRTIYAAVMITRTQFVLAFPDLEKSSTFYRNVLGFAIHDLAPGWLRYERDGVSIMAGECRDALPP